MRAIVVDDSSAMRRIQERTLASLGWEVKSAPNGREALALLEQELSCELLMTDWHMPEMDGIELVRAVRKDQRFSKLKILMVTSETVLKGLETALEAGANDIVLKPFTKEALAERLAEVMRG